jgi:hypothetical protein
MLVDEDQVPGSRSSKDVDPPELTDHVHFGNDGRIRKDPRRKFGLAELAVRGDDTGMGRFEGRFADTVCTTRFNVVGCMSIPVP